MTLKTEEPKKTDKEDTDKNKISETFESLKSNKTVENFIHYAKNHVQDTIAYILMIVAIIFSNAVFPEAFNPVIPKISPSRTIRSIRSRTVFLSNIRFKREIVIINNYW